MSETQHVGFYVNPEEQMDLLLSLNLPETISQQFMEHINRFQETGDHAKLQQQLEKLLAGMEVEMDTQDSKHLTISPSTEVTMIEQQQSSDDDEDFVPTKKPATTPRKKKDETKSQEETKQGEYFWDIKLHYEFMRHFSVYGKTWKVVSAKMSENGIKNKDQLQCRTHGQKYLIGLGEIVESINKTQNRKNQTQAALTMDKKIYQKLQRYEDDKRMLFGLWMQDQINKGKSNFTPKLDFQSDEAKKLFELSIPDCIKDEEKLKNNFGVDMSEPSDVSVNFDDKLVQIKQAIGFEQELYEVLKDLKKEKNRNKRLPQKSRGAPDQN